MSGSGGRRVCGAGSPGPPAAGRRAWVGVWLAGVLAWLGCGDAFDRLLAPVPEEPSEVVLVDFRTGPLADPSAFDAVNGRPVRVDQTSGWDFLFSLTEEGTAQLRPFEAVTGEFNEAGLQKVASSFEGLTVAPEEGYVLAEPIPVAQGDVLAVRSRRDPAFSGLRCRHFGKLEILQIDRVAGMLTFRHLLNPNCETRGLVPGEPGSLDE